jgi:hypothetical protein
MGPVGGATLRPAPPDQAAAPSSATNGGALERTVPSTLPPRRELAVETGCSIRAVRKTLAEAQIRDPASRTIGQALIDHRADSVSTRVRAETAAWESDEFRSWAGFPSPDGVRCGVKVEKDAARSAWRVGDGRERPTGGQPDRNGLV